MNLSAIASSTAAFRTLPPSQPNAAAPAQRAGHGHHRRAAADETQATQSASAFTQSQTPSTGALLDTLV